MQVLDKPSLSMFFFIFFILSKGLGISKAEEDAVNPELTCVDGQDGPGPESEIKKRSESSWPGQNSR